MLLNIKIYQIDNYLLQYLIQGKMAWHVAMDTVGMQNLGNALVNKAGIFK